MKTLGQYPGLIGELLRRREVKLERQARRRWLWRRELAWLDRVLALFGIGV